MKLCFVSFIVTLNPIVKYFESFQSTCLLPTVVLHVFELNACMNNYSVFFLPQLLSLLLLILEEVVVFLSQNWSHFQGFLPSWCIVGVLVYYTCTEIHE